MSPQENALAFTRNQGAKQRRNPARSLYHYTLNPLNIVLSELENVRPYGNGYRADCPTKHRSRGNLIINEGDEGTVLLRCYAGCSALEIVHGMGLELKDLFVKKSPATMSAQEKREHKTKLKQGAWQPALSILAFESCIVEIAATQLQTGKPLNEADQNRLILSGERIRNAKAVLCDR